MDRCGSFTDSVDNFVKILENKHRQATPDAALSGLPAFWAHQNALKSTNFSLDPSGASATRRKQGLLRPCGHIPLGNRHV
jgi:hypothetical protein